VEIRDNPSIAVTSYDVAAKRGGGQKVNWFLLSFQLIFRFVFLTSPYTVYFPFQGRSTLVYSETAVNWNSVRLL